MRRFHGKSALMYILIFRCRVVAMDPEKCDDLKDKAIMHQISREFMQHDLDKGFAGFRDTVRLCLNLCAECFVVRPCLCPAFSRP